MTQTLYAHMNKRKKKEIDEDGWSMTHFHHLSSSTLFYFMNL
jgi:hypothetical protein